MLEEGRFGEREVKPKTFALQSNGNSITMIS